ncbi:MAG: glycosyl hydrolase family 28 protein [Bacteroidota bacterium]
MTDHGAVAGDERLDTGAVQAAIDACAGRGGGTVWVPAGTFDTGTLRLRSRVRLHLDAGAVLRGSTNLADYPLLPELAGDNPGRRRALLAACDAEDVALIGTGMLDGRGPDFAYDLETGEETEGRPMFWTLFQDVERLTVRDVTLRDATGWTLNLQRVEDATIDGVRILNDPRSRNTDGIGLRGARNVRIANVHIDTGDDAIVFKAGSGRPVEHVTVTNSVLSSDDAAIKFGTRTEEAMRHVLIQNVAIRDSRYGVAVFMKDGGTVEDVRVENVSFSGEATRHRTEYPLYLDLDRRDEASPLGVVRRFTVRGLDAATRGNVLIAGRADAPIEDLTLDGVTLRIADPVPLGGLRKPGGKRGLDPTPGSVDLAPVEAHLTLGHIDGLTLRDVTITGPGRRPLHLEAVTNVRFEGITLSDG